MPNFVDINTIKSSIRDIPDFPKKGIIFKDITTALKQPDIFYSSVSYLYEFFKDKNITKVAAIESRGFIIGGALAFQLGAGFVPIRKPGKLPYKTHSIEYELEYGKDSLEIHIDAISKDDVVLIHDDLLATGGTSLAAFELIQKFEPSQCYFSFLCELSFLDGRNKIDHLAPVFCLFSF